MAEQRVLAQKFVKTNKANLKNGNERTRTGALKCSNRKAAHSKNYKH